jgi:hypothetical protein
MCSPVQSSPVQRSAVQCSAMQSSAVQYSPVQSSPVQSSAVQCSTIQHHTLVKTTTSHSAAQSCPQATNFSTEKPQYHDGTANHCGCSPRWHSTCAAQLYTASAAARSNTAALLQVGQLRKMHAVQQGRQRSQWRSQAAAHLLLLLALFTQLANSIMDAGALQPSESGVLHWTNLGCQGSHCWNFTPPAGSKSAYCCSAP